MAVYNITFDGMIKELASRLEADQPDPQFSDPELKRWINLGIIQFARRTKVIHVVKFLWLSAGINRYTTPPDWLYATRRQVLYCKEGTLSGYQYPLKGPDRRGMQATLPIGNSTFLSDMSYGRPSQGFPKYYLMDGGTIEFLPIPSTEAAGFRRICFKYPGIPDALSATSAVPNIPVEYREIPLIYAEHLAMTKDKDPRRMETLQRFYAECAEIEAQAKWGDTEEPPALLPEEYFQGSDWSIA